MRTCSRMFQYYFDKDRQAEDLMCKVHTIYKSKIGDMAQFSDAFIVGCEIAASQMFKITLRIVNHGPHHIDSTLNV